ncbi:helix-turn-helix transcriptional regulator [Mesorhizobium sp. AR10]|uniref:winged helix-turn-helix transcriptional regulator n=1 Tax=Mesorhizobium sp. AR10 TaxID=2865839 RepID=UPI002160B53D|nr:helix-turn-helix domain-containing protein [Mesorhizobium sp. AR10]UVK41353.1 helix-turn-helix transcriptional regulator [Mesorhizobium sp. AR10]
MEMQTTAGLASAQVEHKNRDMRRALAMISGKWKLEIMSILGQRAHRFGELKRAVPGITQHMLTQRLRELENDGLVSRTIFAEIPPRVEYARTELVVEVCPYMDGLLEWYLAKAAPTANADCPTLPVRSAPSDQ